MGALYLPPGLPTVTLVYIIYFIEKKKNRNNLNYFVCCVSGESVTVTVCGTEDETAALLATVLDGDRTAASLLAGAIHQDPATINAHTDGLAVPLDPSQLGIWIDPIGEKAGPPPHVSLPKIKPSSQLFVISRFSTRCYQPVHRGARGGAGGGPPLPLRAPLCPSPHWGVSAQHRRTCDGGHQPALPLQRPVKWTVSENKQMQLLFNSGAVYTNKGSTVRLCHRVHTKPAYLLNARVAKLY